MSAKYWIKLYHEILHDRKMATLDNLLFRRVIECFLFAGEVDKDGYLPRLDDMAWVLRCTSETLETDLNELVKIGILEYRDGLYFVRKFADRQKTMSKAEYMRRKRDENQKQEYYQPSYQPVTDGNADKIRIDKNRIDKIEIEDEPPMPPLSSTPVKVLTDASGLLSFPPKYAGWITPVQEMIYEYGAERTTAAMKSACTRWINTVGQNGQNYRKGNLDWIGWAQEELAASPADLRQKDVKDMTSEEFAQYLERIAAE